MYLTFVFCFVFVFWSFFFFLFLFFCFLLSRGYGNRRHLNPSPPKIPQRLDPDGETLIPAVIPDLLAKGDRCAALHSTYVQQYRNGCGCFISFAHSLDDVLFVTCNQVQSSFFFFLGWGGGGGGDSRSCSGLSPPAARRRRRIQAGARAMPARCGRRRRGRREGGGRPHPPPSSPSSSSSCLRTYVHGRCTDNLHGAITVSIRAAATSTSNSVCGAFVDTYIHAYM